MTSARTFLLWLSLTGALIGSPNAHAANWLQCATSFLAGSQIEDVKNVRVRRQCDYGSCWILSGLTQLEQLQHHQGGKPKILSSDALVYRHLEVKTIRSITSDRPTPFEVFREEGGSLRELLELLTRFGSPEELAWKPKVSLQSDRGEYLLLVRQLEERIRRYHRERDELLEQPSTPDRQSRLQRLFESALKDTTRAIETRAGSRIPSGTPPTWLPRSLLTGAPDKTTYFQYLYAGSPFPGDPIRTPAELTSPAPAMPATDPYLELRMDLPPHLTAPAGYARYFDPFKPPYAFEQATLPVTELLNVVEIEIARGRSVTLFHRTEETGAHDTHVVVIYGVERDKGSLQVSHVLIKDSRTPLKNTRMTRSEFFEYAIGIGYLRDVNPLTR